MKVFSEITRQRMSESAKRRCQTDEFKSQVASYWKPFCTEEELRHQYDALNMSQMEIAAKYGVTLKRVQTSLRRCGIKPRRPIKRNQSGARNSGWKGDAATYQAFHIRVSVARGKPMKCERCGTEDPRRRYDWANLTGHYEDINDYQRMCRSCHSKFDEIHLNFGAAAVKQEVARE